VASLIADEVHVLTDELVEERLSVGPRPCNV